MAPANAARDRAAAVSDATTDADLSSAATTAGELIDTSKNQRIVVKLEYAPVQSISGALVKHFRGIPGMSIVPSITGNSLLVSSPTKWLDEVTDTISKLDQPPRSTTIEVTLIEFPSGAPSKDFNVRDFHGPSRAVRAMIDDLNTHGKIQRFRRFRAMCIDNQFMQFPASDGATVQCTARSSADKGVVMEFVVHDPVLFPPGNVEVPAARGRSGLQSVLSIPSETTVIATEIEPGREKGPARIVILVSAEAILPVKSP